MRLISVTTSNVGGIVDGTVRLPDASVVAFAGGNGTGKSKLLACLLSPWSGTIPASDGQANARVEVRMALAPEERTALIEFSSALGWGNPALPEEVSFIFDFHPTAGLRRSSIPDTNVLNNALASPALVQQMPSLDVVYLPAERRLLPSGTSAIDLSQLSDLMALQKTAEPRSAIHNYGRLDDQEFESFARALCVAASLPSESEDDKESVRSRAQWSTFLETVNAIIAPKKLLPLTRENPEQLRIQTPSGGVHLVQELSSGERQALIIISRVMRAGAGHTLVLVDEPDAYLHPHLSQRLVQALEAGVGKSGQLLVATHSPAILDALPPSSIIRMSHDIAPALVADESERLDLYRSAGFRASTLTQADLLLVVEGDTDGPLLHLQFPQLTRASIQSAGGRARVMRQVEQLSPYDLPILGVVDRDIDAPQPPESIQELITVWPTADIEGLYLSDDAVLALLIDKRLIKSDLARLETLREILAALLDQQRENVVAEIAQRRLRASLAWVWPSPKGPNSVERLREAVPQFKAVSEQEVEAAIALAESAWDEHAGVRRWELVRGKVIANQFASQATEMRSGRALLEAVARERVAVSGLVEFEGKLRSILD